MWHMLRNFIKNAYARLFYFFPQKLVIVPEVD